MMLTVKGFTHFYGNRPAVKDVSLELEEGKLIGLIGPNGAGKSTFMRGVMNPGAYPGTFFFRGKDLSSFSAKDRAREIAYLPQDRPVHWDLDVKHLVTLGRHPFEGAGQGPIQNEAVCGVMKAMEITDLADRPFSTLSGGEQARVHLARTLAGDAPVILADEPVQALDPGHQFQVLDLLRGYVKKRGHCVLMILHELHLAARYCDRLILLYEGAKAAEGPPAQVLTASNLRDYYGIDSRIGSADDFFVLPEGRISHE